MAIPVQRLFWPFLVQRLSHGLAVKMEKSYRVTLKKWAGLYRSADIGSLFRSKDNVGLGLTSVTAHFEQMNILRCTLLRHSSDPNIVAIYKLTEERERHFRGRWCATQVASTIQREVDLQFCFLLSLIARCWYSMLILLCVKSVI